MLITSFNLFGQVNCGGVAITGFSIFNCGVGQSPQLQISVSVCSNQAQAGNWTISYPGGTNTVSFYVQNTCPSAFNCGTPGPSTINLPQNFDCSTINVNNIVITNASGQSPCAFQRVSGCSALPLDILYFNVTQEGLLNKLEWKTTNEVNVNEIVVENSNDGMNFTEIARMKNQDENPLSVRKYTHLHLFSSEVNYYRLKIVDHDLTFSFSEIIQIDNQLKQSFMVFPNPAKEKIYLDLDVKDETQEVNIYDTKGRLRIKFSGNSTDISILESGIYLIQSKRNGIIQAGKFVIM